MVHRHPFAGASAVLLALIVWVTWPQVPWLRTHVGAHPDPLFSMWRLAWVAHALKTDPRHLFDANVFYPEPRTLAYSDATLLEGAIAAPLLWAGARPVIVYNLLLLGAIWTSGLAMFALARRLTGDEAAALVAGAIFAIAPYRLNHFMHLELQWVMWMPLAFIAVHDTIDRGSWRSGVLAGILIWLQILSSVYYGIFLGIAVAILAAVLVAFRWRERIRSLPPLLIGAAVVALLTIPYSRPYVENARTLGPRNVEETIRLSAVPMNYLAATDTNWLWGWTAERFGAMERCLFPGLLAILLAAIGLLSRPRPIVWAYAVLCGVAVEMSLGLNGALYSFLYARLAVFQGLRAPVRFAVVVLCAVSVLAAFGVARINERLPAGRRLRIGFAAAAIAVLGLEYVASPANLMTIGSTVPDLYKRVAQLPPGVVVELPLPTADRLPGDEAMFEYWSTTHWKPLVNGYSGYYPVSYLATLEAMRSFPADGAVDRLKQIGVRYVVLHEQLYEPAEYSRLLLRLARRSDFVRTGQFRDWSGPAQLFELGR